MKLHSVGVDIIKNSLRIRNIFVVMFSKSVVLVVKPVGCQLFQQRSMFLKVVCDVNKWLHILSLMKPAMLSK